MRPFARLIGLTGGIASGKSNARRVLGELGAVCVDADKLGHAAYRSGTQCFHNVVATFGEDMIGEDGEIDRRRLGARVFADRREMEKLNAIVWPVIIDMVWDELRKAAGGTEEKPAEPLIGVVEAAVLIEAGWYKHFDEVWVTHVPVEEAVRRLMERNGLSEEDALTRVRAQMPAEERLQHATVRVDTTGSLEETAGLLTREWEALLRDRAAPGFPSPSAM